MVQTEMSRSEFMDTINKYDSCSLSYAARSALFDHIEWLIDDKIIDPCVCVGDWAVMTSETTLEDLRSEHEDRVLIGWKDVHEAIGEDFLDNCWSDCIVVDDDTAVMVSL